MTAHRSKFETTISKVLGDRVTYESERIKYTVPESKHTYTPDFIVTGTNIRLETKGKLDPDARKKMVLLKEQHPDIRFVFVFQRSKNPLYKGSPTTYKEWATKNGFEVVEPSELNEWLSKEIKKVKEKNV